MYDFLANINIKLWMLIIPTLLFLHEMEEWNILEWYYSTYDPAPKSTNLSTRIWLFIMSIWGYLMITLAYIIPNVYLSAGVVLFLIVFTSFNGLQHIFWLFAFKKYAPGVIFSSLGIVAGIILTMAMLIQGLVSPIIVIVFWAVTVPFIISTIRAKNTLIKTFEYLHNLTLKIVEFLER